MKKFMKMITRNKVWFYLITSFLLILTILNILVFKSILSLNGIENLIRVFVIIIIIIVWILFIMFASKVLLRNKQKSYIIFLSITIIYSILLFFISYNIDKIYNTVNNISSNYTLYSSSIVTLNNNETDNIKDLNKDVIGILNDENSIEGYQIPKEIIKKKKLNNELMYYDSFTSLIDALINNEIKYIFLPTNYSLMFKSTEGYSDISSKTKIIYSQEKKIVIRSSGKNATIDKPFTLLLMGVDSEQENIRNSTFNGDSLMLITFNPDTLNTTILSIPRDTYVPIACFSGQRKNKITHAAWYGEDCMIKTIQNFTGINIDYYLKINFKGVVNLVDALGGIEVDVPFSFCEQNSNREWGNNTIYVEKGFQKLNGEQSLALARNRHSPNDNSDVGSQMAIYCPTYDKGTRNDFARGQNQQLIVKSLLNKAKSIKNLDTVYKLLDTISNNMETNMSTNEILSFYNIGKDILIKSKNINPDELIGLQRLYISGYDLNIVDYSMYNNQGTRGNLYNFIPYNGSINDVVKAMKINLGLDTETIIKTFGFDVNTPYEEKIIGKGYYNEKALELLPNFVGKQESIATNYGKKNNIKVNIEYVASDNENHEIGEIIYQNAFAGMDILYVNQLNIKVVNKINIKEPESPNNNINCALEENINEESCQIPNFIGKTYQEYLIWQKNSKLSISFALEEIKKGHEKYDETKAGLIIDQSVKSGGLFELIGNVFKVTYISETIIDNPGINIDENIDGN